MFGQTFSRIDNLVSPRAGIVDQAGRSAVAVWQLQRLVSAGVGRPVRCADDYEFHALQPEKFTNKEVGSKWDITPLLTFTTAFFQLDRENTPIRDPGGSGHRRCRPVIRA